MPPESGSRQEGIFQHCNIRNRQLRSTCFLKLARPLQLFCTVLSLQQASMQIFPVAPYVDTPAQFNVKHKTKQWEFSAVKNEKLLKLGLLAFRIPSKIGGSLKFQLSFVSQRNDFKTYRRKKQKEYILLNCSYSKNLLILKYISCILYPPLPSFVKMMCYMLRNIKLLHNESFDSQAIIFRPKSLQNKQIFPTATETQLLK